MFFNIGFEKLDNFPVHYQHNDLWINLDSGWKKFTDRYNNLILFKGYIDEFSIEEKLDQICAQEEPLLTGNFCLLKCFDRGIALKTDRLRGFPIWYNQQKFITNLVKQPYTCWTDSYVMITNSGELVESKFNIIESVTNEHTEFGSVVDKIDSLLTAKLQKFFAHNQLPVNVFLSGGIDTMLLYSYIKKLEIPHNLILAEHFDFDYFYFKNHDHLKKFWGYSQIHHWLDENILVSGAPGDEFTVRSPTTGNMMMLYHNTSIPELLLDEKYKKSLHYTYFNNDEYKKIWESQKDWKFDSLGNAVEQCINLNLNDWQHWHIGKTITYTPLRDAKIFELIAKLPKEQLIEQVMNSVVQKTLIEKNTPELLTYLATQKNSQNCMSNLTKLLIKDIC